MLPSVTAVPSGELPGAPVIVAVGATLVTAMVAVAVPTPVSSSVTVSVATYVPLSLGMKVIPELLPVAYCTPSLRITQP